MCFFFLFGSRFLHCMFIPVLLFAGCLRWAGDGRPNPSFPSAISLSSSFTNHRKIVARRGGKEGIEGEASGLLAWRETTRIQAQISPRKEAKLAEWRSCGVSQWRSRDKKNDFQEIKYCWKELTHHNSTFNSILFLTKYFFSFKGHWHPSQNT